MVIPEGLQRAISRQATAERERRAVIVQAEGEKQAADKIREAASILNTEKGAFYVRLLRALPEIASQQGSLIAFPLPVELKYLFPEAPAEEKKDDSGKKKGKKE